MRDDEKRDVDLLRNLLTRWSAEDVLKKLQRDKRQRDARKKKRSVKRYKR
jgi:hypothetical protein